MTYFELFAAIGMVGGDVFVYAGLLGASVFFLAALIGRSPRRLPVQVAYWAFFGNALALLVIGSMYVVGGPQVQVGFLWPISQAMAASLLAVSLLLLVGSWVLRRRQKSIV